MKGGLPPSLFDRRWVHRFEEDTAEGAVYRPSDSDAPLSRRPRELIELDRDGGARVFTGGPDDRARAHAGTWEEDEGTIVVRVAASGGSEREYRIVVEAPDRLLVR